METVTTRTPRILFLDIETAPNIVTLFSLDPNRMAVDYRNIQRERYILTAAWKWFGEREIHGITVRPHRRSWKLFPSATDKPLVRALAQAMAQADVVVGHWGSGFDFPWIRTRALIHQLPPIAPVREFDTCKAARRVFYLNSAKLDYLAKLAGLGKKIEVPREVWDKCVLGYAPALEKMLRYNKHDVWLLEGVFKWMLPYLPPAINQRFFSDRHVCPTCGSDKLQRRGFAYTVACKWQRYQCRKCGAWHRGDKKMVRRMG